MPDLIQPNKSDAFTDKNGLSQDRFYQWVDDITDLVNSLQIEFGSGSPEGSITADVGKVYIDTSASAGTGIYIKESGSGDTGWIARS